MPTSWVSRGWLVSSSHSHFSAQAERGALARDAALGERPPQARQALKSGHSRSRSPFFPKGDVGGAALCSPGHLSAITSGHQSVLPGRGGGRVVPCVSGCCSFFMFTSIVLMHDWCKKQSMDDLVTLRFSARLAQASSPGNHILVIALGPSLSALTCGVGMSAKDMVWCSVMLMTVFGDRPKVQGPDMPPT